ncbi:MAG: hypothetical protein L0Z50_30620 [Verrucomicrobiales bacterium]|nr:hypothetical protein [Verrucomicrobiales bacterium]
MAKQLIAMKTLISTIMILTISSASVVGADDPAISVAIVVPRDGGHGERRVTYRNSGTEWDRAAHFHAIVSNRSEKPQRIWQEGCSWGYFALSFEFTDEAGKKWEAKKGMTPFVMNRPAYWSLEPSESTVLEVYFADPDIWKDFPRPDNGSKVVVSMRAIFEIRSTPESTKHDVWTGRVVSEARRITFHRPKK